MALDLSSSQLYFNRELSWLQFNSRVLAQALDEQLPPLERLKFLAIYGTNLDEFYMIRVAGLKALYKAGIQETGPDKLTPSQQLEQIHGYLHEEHKVLESCYTSIISELHTHGVNVKNYDALNQDEKLEVKEKFFHEIYPVIIPIAVDATHPFPHLNNLSFGLALTLKDDSEHIKHGLVRIPRILPRFIQLGQTFIPIESVVEYFASELFPGFSPLASTPFRVTRNADIEIEEEEADDFLEILQEGLRSRNKGSLIRLELNDGADSELINFLLSHLNLDDKDIYSYKSLSLNLGGLWQIVGDKALSHLVLPTFSPKVLPPLNSENVFEAIEKQDVLLYHPFDSFEPVVKFIKQAAADPETITIRMTLYRAGPNSPIVKALIDAVRDGKQVMVLVELKARFDEENNLRWARALEDAGAHVVYGIPGLKVHAKIAQVIKRQNGKLKSYVHLATGNYNPSTSKIYTDMSYFTTKEVFSTDATHFFHFLTGFSTHTKLDTLFMSPTQIKPKLLKLIEKEYKHGSEGHIILKANSLVDADIIKALYTASQKGCKVDLIIRGICCLKPGIKGISENITVSSVIGKYLEHARIYFFKHDKIKCYIASADLMPRNLVRRVELMTPILEETLRQKIEQILMLQLADNTLRWELQEDGNYTKVPPLGKTVNNHAVLEEYVNKIHDKTKKETPDYVSRLANRILKDS
ncbi:RNA degradosome polyphosphate kinase [Sulfurovum sp. XGS-02]|uniref:RNA degradosome polyphosphate kinase n=1 Tax=Sulfurovum sp. XGS-02 TaxID=2925411 RepID=UPI002045DD06|nr:RNA degradosome polyphosphate kinase [Sulfurovum sp. XGS-02]UPT77313.1 RNA degradosome polyphosphate kinase [Sulfurovum sp. XGS-02]